MGLSRFLGLPLSGVGIFVKPMAKHGHPYFQKISPLCMAVVLKQMSHGVNILSNLMCWHKVMQ